MESSVGPTSSEIETMTVDPGTILGQYEILGSVGSGGMGEVWRAHDTTLGRQVALKILPEDFEAESGRHARFEREAKVLASLNHPNIATLHALEHVNGLHVLAMELVEGEDLDDRLKRGPIPLDEALPIAVQMAEALEAAHDKGIVHRDFKPANVKIRPDGTVKVLDFGLAKAWADEPLEHDPHLSSSPTMTKQGTAAGIILGTASYMSPEQARSKPVDRRADIWSFGVVVWEMLTGSRLFDGETVGDVLAALHSHDPDWDQLPKSTPSQIRRVLKRCLEREPERRLRDIADARLELEDCDGEESSSIPSITRRLSPWVLVAALSILLLGTVVWISLGDRPQNAVESAVVYAEIGLPAGKRVSGPGVLPLGIGRPVVAISPDGSTVACAIDDDGTSRLFLRRLDEEVGVLVPGTEGAFNPSFSPSGQWLLFSSGSTLKRFRALGGPVETIREIPNILGTCWISETEIVVASAEARDFVRIDLETGAIQDISDPNHPSAYGWPSRVPGGTHVVIGSAGGFRLNPDSFGVDLLSLARGSVSPLITGGVSPHVLHSGHLVLAKAGGLSAAEFDLTTLTVKGQLHSVLGGVLTEALGVGQFDVAENGTLVYVPGESLAIAELVWLDRNGAVERLDFPPQVYGDFQLSPDGTRLAVTAALNQNEIWVYDLDRGTRQRISNIHGGQFPIWSPDGRRIAYWRNADGDISVVWREVGGQSGEHEVNESRGAVPYQWTTDDRILVSGPDSSIRALAIDDAVSPQELVQSAATNWGPSLSPDGRWLAYTSDTSGRYEVYVQGLDSEARIWPISRDGGEEPIWSSDGASLIYRNGDAWLEVPILGGDELGPGEPVVIAEGAYQNVPGRSFDISEDGSRLILLRPFNRSPRSDHLKIVLGWSEALRRTTYADSPRN